MKKIKVILELGKDGYGTSFKGFPTVFGFGETVEKAKSDAQVALNGYVKALEISGQSIPEILQGEYELVFEFDIIALLKYIDGTVTKTALAKACGMNASQLTHYSSGLKKPRKEQREKIINGLHRIGNDLIAVY
jgi:predicted RNase H-like HicB family nuclease